MAKTPKAGEKIRVLHAIEALGNIPARAGDIRLERLETRLTPRVPFPHRHDFYHFILVEKGGGWHEIDFQRFPVKQMQLFFVKPGQVHSWHLSPKTRGFILEFTRESLPPEKESAAFLSALEEAPATHSAMGEPAFGLLFRLMDEEFRQRGPGYRLCLEHCLKAFLLGIVRLGKGELVTPAALPAAVKDFRELVEKDFRREHKVDAYARTLGLSPKRLTSLVARALGKSAGTVIQDRCLAEAKRLLAYSDMPVSQVGYELGFEDPNYFARFFRKRAGIAPGKFRRLASQSVPA